METISITLLQSPRKVQPQTNDKASTAPRFCTNHCTCHCMRVTGLMHAYHRPSACVYIATHAPSQYHRLRVHCHRMRVPGPSHYQEWLRKQCLAVTTESRLNDGPVITHVWQCTRMRWAWYAHAVAMYTQAMVLCLRTLGLRHACDGQCTRVLWRCGNSLFRQASRDHTDTYTDTERT